jgi:hypothetical protein
MNIRDLEFHPQAHKPTEAHSSEYNIDVRSGAQGKTTPMKYLPRNIHISLVNARLCWMCRMRKVAAREFDNDSLGGEHAVQNGLMGTY